MTYLQHSLLFVLLCTFSTVLTAQCDTSELKLTLEIDPDFYYDECSWTITNSNGSIVYATGTPDSENAQTFSYCLPKNECLKFNIKDQYGDGINPGSYSLLLNGIAFYTNQTGSYGEGETIPFNCPPGTSCVDPLPMPFGTSTSPLEETWYALYPDQTGIYKISTCHVENSCRTKIWVYNRCNNIFINDDNLGTIFYADSGCPGSDKAQANLYLAANTLYYIRLGSYDSTCVNNSIVFDLSYLGPISGCMDTTACNFEPLATLPDTCYYIGSPDCKNGPDLLLNENRLKQFFQLVSETNNDACEVYEGCTNGYGTRHKIKFSTQIFNIGTQDYFIGRTPSNINILDPTGQFVYDPCHGHWHYRGYAEYLLADNNGNILPIGSKNGFCVLDLTCTSGESKYTCDNMGITAGCEDEYDYTLPCQWIDITDLEAGQYTMICRVNWDQTPDQAGREELSYDNNWGQVCFDLTYTGSLPDIEVLDDCPQFMDCEGVVRGNAKRDCKGDCNGVTLKGDLNQDTLRTDADLQLYLSQTIQNDGVASPCTDLHDDGTISLYDAALLNECLLHRTDVEYWSSSFACLFPTGQENPNDRHIFRLRNLNPSTRTFDIELSNNSRALYGVDMTLSGVVLESVEEISSTFDDVVILTNNAAGRLVALTTNEKGVARSSSFKQLFKVKYSALTNDTICIAAVREVVNDLYELATPILSNSICVTDPALVGNEEARTSLLQIHAFPNPVNDKTTLVFPEIEGERVAFTLVNSVGQVMRSWTAYNNRREEMYRKDLPAGIYQVEVRGENGKGIVRMMFE